MRKVTFTPSSLDRYAANGVQRSVTPEAFSAGTTAKVSSGYLPFQSCAEAAVVKASAAAPARTMRRLIMVCLSLWLRYRPLAVCNGRPVKMRWLGRRRGAERRNGRVAGHLARRGPHDLVGFEIVKLACDVVGQNSRRPVEHDAARGHSDQTIAI